MWNLIARMMPVIGAYVVIRVIFWKKKNKNMESTKNTKEYTIKSDGMVVTIFCTYTCFSALLLCGCLLKYGIKDIFTIVCILFVLLGVIGSLNVIVWQVQVKNSDIVLRTILGIKHYYTFSDISSGTYEKNGAFIVYTENKRIIKFDNNMAFGKFVMQMMQNHIPVDYK